jgi:hypothetical protein
MVRPHNAGVALGFTVLAYISTAAALFLVDLSHMTMFAFACLWLAGAYNGVAARRAIRSVAPITRGVTRGVASWPAHRQRIQVYLAPDRPCRRRRCM